MDHTPPPSPESGRTWASEPMVRRALELVGQLEPREYTEPEHAEQFDVDKRALDAVLLRSAARGAGVDVVELSPDTSLFRAAGAAWVVHKNMPAWLTGLDRAVTNNKHLTKQVLAASGLPVARGQVVATFEQAREAFDQMPRPVVTKPVTGSGGRGVSVDIRTVADLEAGCADITERGRSIVIEEMAHGVDLRIMTIAGRAVATSLRVPANVVGDGHSTMAELVAAKNSLRAANPYTRHSPIDLDTAGRARLAAQGMTTESIPPAGERVFLHRVANVSSGGDCYEVGDLVHPDLLRLAEQAAACFPSATHAGMDILAERIDAGLDTQRVIIAEVNLNNEIPMHIMPTYGESTSVHKALIEAVLASPPVGNTAGTQPTATPPDAVDVAYLEGLLTDAAASNPPAGTEPPDHHDPDDPDDTLMPGREADGHQLRQEFLTAGYRGAAYRGALMFLRRDSADAVLHRSGRSVVSREVGRRPEVLHALATVLGIPALDPADLRQQPSSSSLTCQVLLIEGEVAGTLLSPSGGPDDDDPQPGDDGHLSRPTPPGMGLAHCPFPELAGYAEVLRAPLGATPILALSFALRPGADGQVWALQSLDPDPELAPFADPAAGVTADVYPSAAAALLKPDPYLLPPGQ